MCFLFPWSCHSYKRAFVSLHLIQTIVLFVFEIFLLTTRLKQWYSAFHFWDMKKKILICIDCILFSFYSRSRWGRVGYVGQNAQGYSGSDLDAAIKDFEKKVQICDNALFLRYMCIDISRYIDDFLISSFLFLYLYIYI